LDKPHRVAAGAMRLLFSNVERAIFTAAPSGGSYRLFATVWRWPKDSCRTFVIFKYIPSTLDV
jgi:hypothetical protein